MFYQTSMGLIYLIFNQLPFLWDTSDPKGCNNPITGIKNSSDFCPTKRKKSDKK